MADTRQIPWRRVLTGGLIVAAVITTMTLVRRNPPVNHAAPPVASPSPNSPSPTRSLPPGVDAAPSLDGEPGLTQLLTELPVRVVLDPAGVGGLAGSPTPRALALIEVRREDEPIGAIFVLGADRVVRSLDVINPAPVEDANGSRHSPFRASVLRSDGVLAAIPQRDRVALIDLTTGSVRWVPVPGFNEHVVWHGDELLVAQADATFRINAESGQVRRTTLHGFTVAATDHHDSPIVELTKNRSEHLLLRIREADLPVVEREVHARSAVTDWLLPGWTSGHRIAVGVVMTSPSGVPSSGSVVVVDRATARQERQLVPSGTQGFCCSVAGWLNARTVLVYAPGTGWLMAWDITTGVLNQVTRFTSATGGTINVSLSSLTH